MSVPIAYLTVILVWSTTPLGIAFSSETVNPTMAVLLRMVIASVIGYLALKVWSVDLPVHRKALKLYFYSVIGVFGGMLMSYLSAAYITTGVISLVFGLSPIISGVLSQKILATPKLSATKNIAMVIAFTGLVIVFSDNINMGADGYIGMVYILSAVFLFSLSGVLVKSVDIDIHPSATTVGSLLMSVPLYFITWLIIDGSLNIEQWSEKSLAAIAYLGVLGSLVGFMAYFYVLQKLTATTVSLITMVTPVIAIVLGSYLNGEAVTENVVYGASCIIAGLALYQWSSFFVNKRAAAPEVS